MRIRATILQSGTTACGIEVPSSTVDALGSGKRPKVKVTLRGYTYRTSIAPINGVFMVSVSADVRRQSGVAAGDTLDIDLELDTEPRVVIEPADLTAALDASPDARRTYDALSYSNKSWHVLQIDGAKSAETRQRRVAKSIEALGAGRVR